MIDAFNSDAIPTHLLTQECFEIYWRHLKPDGILVIQITNTYVDLREVIYASADRHEKTALWIVNGSDRERRADATSHILLTSSPVFSEHPTVQQRVKTWNDPRRLIWTDDYSNLFRILKRRKR